MENLLVQINNVGLKFLSPLSVKEAYHLIIKEAVKLTNASSGLLYVAHNGDLQRVSSFPLKTPHDYHIRKKGFTYKAYIEKKVIFIDAEEIVTIHPELQGFGYKTAICIPLADHEKSIGTIVVLSHDLYPDGNKFIELFKIYGAYASLAIKQATLSEERENALKLRDFFISMAAHELRTPLTAVNGYIQLLFKKLEGSSGSEAKWVKNLLWESQRLSLLINELLEVDQIKSGKFQFRWMHIDIHTLIERAINNVKFIYPNREITYTNELNGNGDSIIGDFDKLLQALTNLLENAAKFSDTNTPIILTLAVVKKNLTISIQDFGIGIPPDLLPKLFEGYTIDTQSQRQGMGLGLYLVKNIVKLHHGNIDIKTKEKSGTTITLSLPKATTNQLDI